MNLFLNKIIKRIKYYDLYNVNNKFSYRNFSTLFTDSLNINDEKINIDLINENFLFYSSINNEFNKEIVENKFIDVGIVRSVSDGIITISGLINVQAGELLKFRRTNVLGMALNLNHDTIDAVIFDT